MNPTLQYFYTIPGYVWLWIAFLISGALFGLRMLFLVRTLRLGKAEDRFSHPGQRLKHFVLDVLLQPRFREPLIWFSHLLIFWGFVVYAGSFWLSLFKGLLPFLPYPMPDEIGVVSAVLDLFGILVILALLAAAFRRYVLHPVGLKQSNDATFILLLIGSLMVTYLVGSGAQSLQPEGASLTARPVGTLLGSWFAHMGMNQVAAASLALTMWWAHILLVLGFLAYLPFSKHMHLLFSPFGVYFTSLAPKGTMPNEEASAELPQELLLRDFTWRELMTPLSCAECGRCDRSCPAYPMNEVLSPQKFLHHVKEFILDTASGSAGDKNARRQLIDGFVSTDEIWACTTCYSCMERCPVRNEHLPLFFRMRRFLVGNGKVETRVQDTLTSLSRYGNSFGQSDRARAKWTQGFPLKIKDARKEPVEYLWFVGDYASYDPRLQEITRTVARVFTIAGVDFGILYDSERNAGNDVRRVGEEGLYEMLAEKNIAALSRAKFSKIVTTDPHTYNTLKNEYTSLGGTYDVVHYTELLSQLLRTGRIPLNGGNGTHRATYHDPCYLGRYNGIYEQPREVLRLLGIDLVEMPRNRKDGYCCGAGGGRIWMEDKPGITERPSENRVREAVALDGVTVLATACPKDVVMFQDAVKTTGNEQKIAVKDVAELVWERAQKPPQEA